MLQMKVNLPQQTRLALEQAAEKNGWSLNREVVSRLDASTKDDSSCGDGSVAVFCRALGSALAAVEHQRGKSIFEDLPTALAGRQAVLNLLDTLTPMFALEEIEQQHELLVSIANAAEMEIRDRERKGERVSAVERLLIRVRHRQNAELQVTLMDRQLKRTWDYRHSLRPEGARDES